MCEENVKVEETVVETIDEVVEEKEAGIEIEPLFEEYVDFETFCKSDFRVVKVKECSAVKKSKKLLFYAYCSSLSDSISSSSFVLSFLI